MNRFLIAFSLIAMTMVGCQQAEDKSNNPKTTISGSVANSPIEEVTLWRVANDFLSSESIERCQVAQDGEFSFDIEIANDSPAEYYKLSLGEEYAPITLIVEAGDNITLDVEAADDLYTKYSIEGSEESKLLKEFNDIYFADANRFVSSLEANPSEAVAIAQRAMRGQIGFITKYADKLASVYAIVEDFYEQYTTLQGITTIHIESVRDALAESYPSSPYIEILTRNIDLNKMLLSAEESTYLDITLTDINRTPYTLSDFQGKVTVLCFWSAYEPFSTPLIAEFKQIYNRYHDKGLEAYFVSTDSDRSSWITTVRQQQHPWPSVFGYDNPAVFSAYNVEITPTIYIIDREGNITAGVIDPKALESDIKRAL